MNNNLKKDKVSIIVAVYKSEKFLDKLINSIINQTYNNIEIILVNDGSPDKSGLICDEYAKKDDRIIVIHKENGGVSDARNKGLDIATGDYVVIVDGDDWLSDDYVEYMMKLIKDTNSEMAFSYNLFTTRDQIQIKNDKINVLTAEQAICEIIYPRMVIGPWNKIYSNKILKEHNIRFDIPWFGEGIYFSTKVAKYSKRIATGRRKVYNYRLNNQNSGLTNYKFEYAKNALNNINITKKELNINNPKVNNAINWHIWKNYNFMLLQIIGSNKQEEYKKEYKDCLKYIHKKLPSVLINSEVNLKEKMKIIIRGLFPVIYAKAIIKKKELGLKKDIVE